MCLLGDIMWSYKQTRLTLKTVQPNSISKTHIAIHFNLLHFWPSVLSFLFAVLLKCSFTFLSGCFLYFNHWIGWPFPSLNLDKIRDTVPLIVNSILFWVAISISRSHTTPAHKKGDCKILRDIVRCRLSGIFFRGKFWWSRFLLQKDASG